MDLDPVPSYAFIALKAFPSPPPLLSTHHPRFPRPLNLSQLPAAASIHSPHSSQNNLPKE